MQFIIVYQRATFINPFNAYVYIRIASGSCHISLLNPFKNIRQPIFVIFLSRVSLKMKCLQSLGIQSARVMCFLKSFRAFCLRTCSSANAFKHCMVTYLKRLTGKDCRTLFAKVKSLMCIRISVKTSSNLTATFKLNGDCVFSD